MLNQAKREKIIEEFKRDSEEIWQLIYERLKQYGWDISKLADLTRYSAAKIKRGISGEFELVTDDFLEDVVNAFGLKIGNRTHSKTNYQDKPTRSDYIALLRYAPKNYEINQQSNMLEDWGC